MRLATFDVGQEVFIERPALYDRSGNCTLTITKVGRKYAYTSDHNVIISLKTGRTVRDYRGTCYAVWASEAEYKEESRKRSFIWKCQKHIQTHNLSYEQAKQIAAILNIEE